ncbi:hypothetical protein [Kitasatospora sp. NRRL B-11411]|uniref:hypothetical protein n=1 Tax=Kitasatospora sp. NRRL B-11411 TaxID=1463822 RepID=UPI0004C2DBFE|nr:hypothetical protein [Kitasatospora sp. NRRL B-11411]
MPDQSTGTRPVAVAALGFLAALGVAAAIVAAVSHSYTGCAVGLIVLGATAFAAYRAARTVEVHTDQLILQRLQQDPTLDEHALAVGLGLRPAAVRPPSGSAFTGCPAAAASPGRENRRTPGSDRPTAKGAPPIRWRPLRCAPIPAESTYDLVHG